MLSEILKIKPQLDNSDLNKMEKTLGQRFGRIAKGFGKGLTSAIKGGAVAGVALGLIDKLLNPLKEVQEAIERSLALSDDLVTNARQFGTTAGNLAKLQAFGKSTGLAPDALNLLLTKFQTSVAEASADPNKPSAVRNFVGEKDTAKAFFEFIQSLQKLDKTQQLLVQQEVFGEKQILKMSDFLNTDFAALNKYFKDIDAQKLTNNLGTQADLNDLKETLGAVRELKDINTKAGLINRGTITQMENSKQIALNKENSRISNFDMINNVNDKMNEISKNIEDLAMNLLTNVPILVKAVEAGVALLQKAINGWGLIFKALKDSRLLKYFTGGTKGE